MLTNNDREKTVLQKLQQILETAIDCGADSIELEIADGGLEVTYMSGNMGYGELISDHELIGRVICLIIDRAKLENKSRGVMIWTLSGRQYRITVKEYESFGESAFRLKLGEPT